MYHKSKYNYVYKKSKNEWVIFNTFSGAIILLDDENKKKFDDLSDDNISNDSEFIENLVGQGILVDNKYDEKQLIDASRARRVFNERSAYLRILTTTACNARCEYCYEKGFKIETMTLETANKLVDYILKLPRMDKFYIHWFGGEPLLNENIIDLVMKKVYNFLKKQGTEIYVYFTSNGSLLNKKMAKKAKKLWHANRFQITIDDIGDKYNDVKKYINKKYNYDVVIKNIQYLLEQEIQTIIRINYMPTEVEKVKRVIDELSERFKAYCKNQLLVFDAAPIFEMKSNSCSSCERVYNMSEPAKYLIGKGLANEDDALNIKFKGGQCYACHQGSFVVDPKGNLYKCTVTIKDKDAIVGNIFSGIDRNKYYFKWVDFNLSEQCNECTFLPLCQGGCRAGQLGYMDVFCKRNISEINEILNYKVSRMILKKNKKIELIDFSKCINKEVYEMYQDIPANELGSNNKFNGLSYAEFEKLSKEIIEEETVKNPKINSTTKRYILFVDDIPVGELGIRTTIDDFWTNKGSQVFYKIKISERNKGYGTEILKLGIEECKRLGFKTLRINCDNKNIASQKIILKNGGVPDIIDYETKNGYSTSYLITIK